MIYQDDSLELYSELYLEFEMWTQELRLGFIGYLKFIMKFG